MIMVACMFDPAVYLTDQELLKFELLKLFGTSLILSTSNLSTSAC